MHQSGRWVKEPCRPATGQTSLPDRPGLIKPTGRIDRQDYMLFLRAAVGKITFLRGYFDPVRAAKALQTLIFGFDT